jgi:WD40 repeat protein
VVELRLTRLCCRRRSNWRKAAFRRRLLPKQHTAAVFCLAFDDEHIVTGSSDHTVQVWDVNSGAPLRSLTGHQYAVWNLKVCATTTIPVVRQEVALPHSTL